MREKKLRKQLMAIGIQRNDAAGFIRACRAIQRAGKRQVDYRCRMHWENGRGGDG